MPYARPEALVSTEWLAAHLDDPHVRVLDSSYKQPGITPTAREDYDAGHIPGAVFFDIDDVAEPGTSLPHMIPSAERFAEKMAERGIGNDDRVIVYDTVGLSSAGRAWWMLRLFGHDNVALARRRAAALEGGGPAARNRRADHPAAPLRRPLPARAGARQGGADRRSRRRIASRSSMPAPPAASRAPPPETWPGRRRGHIPGSRNLPFDRVTDPQTRRLRSAEELHRLFDEAGVRLDRPDRRRAAARASPPARSPLRRICSAIPAPRSMTAPGRNGACPTARRSRPARPRRQ